MAIDKFEPWVTSTHVRFYLLFEIDLVESINVLKTGPAIELVGILVQDSMVQPEFNRGRTGYN